MKLIKAIKNIFKETPRFPEVDGEWHSAGILFTYNNSILVGYKHNKLNDNNWLISGFGGKKMEDELYYQTAIRETLEELYETPVTKYMIDFVYNLIKPIKVVNNDGYILMICDLKYLNSFMLTAINFMLDTPVYEELPYSISALIGSRNDKFQAEYVYLGIISINMLLSGCMTIDIDPYLLSDIKELQMICDTL